MILDNVDDASFLFEARGRGQERESNHKIDTQPLVSYLPRCPNGSILITTRSQDAALRLVELRDIITVVPMRETDALALLEKKLGEHYDNSSTPELAAALEFMPLAIVQSAAYIYRRAPRCSVRQYLEEFQKSDRKKASLLNFEGGQLRRDVEAKNSIIITWQLSFDHIRQIRPSAADLLSLMSFFDRQGISEDLLKRRQKTADKAHHSKGNHDRYYIEEVAGDDNDGSTDDEGSTDSDTALEDDISTLRSYSFISVAANGVSFEMHGLVQLATQKWLEAYGQREQWKQQFIRNLDAKFPTRNYENWDICQRLFPHAKSAAIQKPKERDSLIEWASLLCKAAWYSLDIGNWPDAETVSLQSMKETKEASWDRPSLHADQHGQPGVDIQKSRAMGRGGRARGASDGDEQEETGGGPSLHADQHGQPGVDIQESRSMGRGGRARRASDGDEQEETGVGPSLTR